MKYCIIDVGTNSIRMMIALCKPNGFEVLEKQRDVVRIGDELALTGKLSKRGMVDALEVVKRYCIAAKKEGATAYAFGTSAVRDATNRQEFLKDFKEQTGLDMDVLTGEQEARVGFCGALGEAGTGTVIEVGGGSTQVYCAVNGEMVLGASAPIGCVRAMSIIEAGGDCFAQTKKYLKMLEVDCMHKGKTNKKRFDKVLQLAKKQGGAVYAIGGTASTLCSLASGMTQGYDSRIIQGRALTQGEIMRIYAELFKQTLEVRKKIPILHDRADTILYGAALLCECMEELEAFSVRTSDADNLEGYLLTRVLH